MGFSMGAKHALAAALRDKAVSATVLWYGETVKDPQKLRQLAGPVLLVMALVTEALRPTTQPLSRRPPTPRA
jgi:dienelactone hydrolase